MREEEPASDVQTLRRVLLIVGVVAGVAAVAAMVVAVWCCLARRSHRRAPTTPHSPTAHNPLLFR